MALNAQVLEDALRAIPPTTLTPPGANLQAAVDLSNALSLYYSDANSGVTVVTVSSDSFVPILKATLDANNLIETLGTSIQSWSATWTWLGTGFTGPPSSTVCLGPDLDVKLLEFVNKSIADVSNPPKDNIAEFVSIIDNWSKTIIVNLVKNSDSSIVPTIVI